MTMEKTMGRIGFGVLGLLALAACGDTGIRGSGSGTDLPLVEMKPNAAQIVPPGRWKTDLAVRAFVPDAEGGWVEMPGSRCRVSGGDYFTADLVTPARLVLPDLGPDAPQLVANCTNGQLAGQAVVQPAYGWPEEGRPSGVRRAGWGGGWWWGYEKTGPLVYPDLAVALR